MPYKYIFSLCFENGSRVGVITISTEKPTLNILSNMLSLTLDVNDLLKLLSLALVWHYSNRNAPDVELDVTV